MALLSAKAGRKYTASGQFGFLSQHAEGRPVSQWGFDVVAGNWDSDTQTFAQAPIDAVVITPANFIQYKAPTENYDGPSSNTSPVQATVDIIDFVQGQRPGAAVYLYEGWPDMSPFLSPDFPPSPRERDAYEAATLGSFHQWHLDYQDAVLAARPDARARLIPVGPTIVKLADGILSGIPTTELWEDEAPHGRATWYFLAGLVTYMATYGVEAPPGFDVPEIVHPEVRTHYAAVVDFIWAELQGLRDDSGASRVW